MSPESPLYKSECSAERCSNLEWSFGYAPRFGVTIVDRENGFKRTPKDSAYVLRNIFAHAIKA